MFFPVNNYIVVVSFNIFLHLLVQKHTAWRDSFLITIIIIGTDLLSPWCRLWPLPCWFLQELVKEMVDMDIELMRKNPNAWDQTRARTRSWRHSWVQPTETSGGTTFAFYDFISLPFVRRGVVCFSGVTWQKMKVV